MWPFWRSSIDAMAVLGTLRSRVFCYNPTCLLDFLSYCGQPSVRDDDALSNQENEPTFRLRLSFLGQQQHFFVNPLSRFPS